jgi:rod shape-determining protein MreC
VALPHPSGRARYRLALLILTAVVLLTLDFRNFGPLDRAQHAVRDVLAPVRGAVATVVRPGTNALKGVFDYGDVKAENARLRAQLEAAQGQQLQGARDSEELQRLLREYNIPYVGDIPRVQARRVSGPAGNFDKGTIEIDKGSSSGLKENMAVVTNAGLVGKLIRVDSTRATVQLITEPDFAVGVRVGEEITIARGTGPGGTLKVSEGVSRETRATAGDVVLTSGGASSRFPADVPVGRIETVNTDSGTGVVTIKPAADVSNVDYVTVLRYEAPR